MLREREWLYKLPVLKKHDVLNNIHGNSWTKMFGLTLEGRHERAAGT